MMHARHAASDLRNHSRGHDRLRAHAELRNGSGLHVRGHDRGYDAGDTHSSVLPRIRRLIQASRPHLRSEADVLRQAAHVATADRELLYTTFQMDKARFQLVMLTQWMGNLRGRGANALLVGTDAATCHVVRNASMPCWVDEASPKLRGKQNAFGHQVLVKWWYAKVLSAGGYRVIFSDSDVAWMRDPFAHWDRTFELQGLSDIRSMNVTTQRHHEITCMRGWMESMYEHSKRSIYPCQSTGLWFARDCVACRAFFDGLYGYLEERPNEWEQKAFQLMVMRYLVGLGDELPPLRYRLLPTSRYVNIEFYEERARANLDVAGTVAVHCGYLKAMGDKFEHLELNGLLARGIDWYEELTARLRGAAPRNRTHRLTLRRKNRTMVTVLVAPFK